MARAVTKTVRRFGFCHCGRAAPDKPLEKGWHQTGIGASLVLVCPACTVARGLKPPVAPERKQRKPTKESKTTRRKRQ